MNNQRIEWNAGDVAIPGVYVCECCMGVEPETVIIQNDSENLPECKSCGGTIWRLVSAYKHQK